jgi:CheY-like chemotaxis protein
MRILFADDDFDTRFLVQRVLRRHGHIVEAVEDGLKLISKLFANGDLVLMW